MSIENLARKPEQTIRKMQKKTLDQPGFHAMVEAVGPAWSLVRGLPVINGGPGRPQVVFESDKTGIGFVRTPEIQLLELLRFAILNCLPKEAGHRTHVVKALIRAAVLINNRLLVTQRQNAGDRKIINSSYVEDQP